MTRRPSEVTWNGVEGPELPATLELDDRSYELSLDVSGRVMVTSPDLHVAAGHVGRIAKAVSASGADAEHARRIWLDVLADVPRVTRPIAQVTGSHNYLAFWVAGDEGRELRQLPFVYQLNVAAEAGKWAPRREVFLQPPDALPHFARWNANCIQCHAVAGQPHQREGLDPRTGFVWVTYDTEVGELGIACEACHGPGKEHATRMRSPLNRELARHDLGSAGRDLRIANPGTLDAERASAVCGQCHSYFVPRDAERWWDSGFVGGFAAGQGREELAASRQILLPDESQLARVHVSRDVASIFWGDGTIRVGGREYNSLLTSECYTSGEGERKMSCTSCHSLHGGQKAGQLRPEVQEDPDWACGECHQVNAGHSGHGAGSIGRKCVNCHMPRRTYALLKGIRDHRVQSPSARLSDPPSPCTLCHVDQTESWLRQAMARLFPGLGTGDAPSAEDETDEIPLAVRQALQGNAAVRAIYAHAFGQPEAATTVGAGYGRVVLEQLSRDPYAAVRRVAARSLLRMPASPERTTGLSSSDIERLHEARDRSPIVISE